LDTDNLIALVVFIGPLLGLISFLAGIKLTGMKRRNYSVLNPNDVVNGKKVIKIIEEYKPIIYQTENIKKDIQFIFYELVEQKDKLVLIYRPLWNDEIHPNLLIHLLYKFFRWFFYGSTRDIEFVELFIDKKSGKVLSFSFESLTEGSSIKAPGHEFIEIEKKGSKYYNKTKNEVLDYEPIENSRCILQVKTWNHLLTLTGKPKGKKFDIPLEPLTNWKYQRYSISRRSSGYIKTKTKKWVKYFVSIFSLIIFGTGFPLLLFFLLR